MDARIAPPFMEATDASRLVCVVVVSVSYQEYSLTHGSFTGSSGGGERRRGGASRSLKRLKEGECVVYGP